MVVKRGATNHALSVITFSPKQDNCSMQTELKCGLIKLEHLVVGCRALTLITSFQSEKNKKIKKIEGLPENP